jgi:hypothetical protein
MSVIGCVWGAHRILAERHDGFPSYAWCEDMWKSRLRAKAPAPAAVPNWLEMELWAAWRRHLAGDRPPAQLRLEGVAW